VAQAGRVTIVHGHGSGALRDAVRNVLGAHPLVRDWRPGERGEGGDGASVVSF
jgi:DNA mismatch repair protein MutS2